MNLKGKTVTVKRNGLIYKVAHHNETTGILRLEIVGWKIGINPVEYLKLEEVTVIEKAPAISGKETKQGKK